MSTPDNGKNIISSLNPTLNYLKVLSLGLKIIVVAKDGTGNYTTIYDALQAGHKLIFVKAGTYIETNNLVLNGQCLFGESPKTTIIQLTGNYIDIKSNTATDSYSTGTITLTQNSTVVAGAGTNWNGGANPPSLYADPWIMVNGSFLKVATFAGPGLLDLSQTYRGTTTALLNYFIFDANSIGSIFTGFQVQHTPIAALNCMRIGGASNQVYNNYFMANQNTDVVIRAGISANAPVFNLCLKNNVINSGQIAITLRNAQTCIIQDNVIQNQYDHGIFIDTSSGDCKYNTINKNTFMGQSNASIDLATGTSETIITENNFIKCPSFNIVASQCNSTTIAHNFMQSATTNISMTSLFAYDSKTIIESNFITGSMNTAAIAITTSHTTTVKGNIILLGNILFTDSHFSSVSDNILFMGSVDMIGDINIISENFVQGTPPAIAIPALRIQGNNGRIIDNLIWQCEYGIEYLNGANAVVKGNIILHTKVDPLYLTGPISSAVVSNNVISNFNFAGFSAGGIVIGAACDRTVCCNNIIHNDALVSANGISISGPSSTVKGNIINSVGLSGITLLTDAAIHANIEGNLINSANIGINLAGLSDFSVSNNRIFATGSYGIHKAGLADNCTIIGNSIHTAGGGGIYISTFGQNLTVSHNTIFGISAGNGITLNGATGHYNCSDNLIDSVDRHGININTNNVTCCNNKIYNFNIANNYNGINQTAGSTIAVISNNTVHTDAGTGGNGIAISGTSVTVQGNNIYLISNSGIATYSNSAIVSVLDNQINGTATGISLSSDQPIFACDGNSISNTTGAGISKSGASGNGSISGNKIITAGASGINITASGGFINIDNNSITGCTLHGIDFSGGPNGNSSISNNTITSLGRNGIYLDNPMLSTSNNNITFWNVSAGGYAAIHVAANALRVRILQNTISNPSTTQRGIYSSADYSQVSHNSINGITTGIEIATAHFCIISENHINISSIYGIYVHAGNGNKILNNIIQDSNSHGIYKNDAGSAADISGNSVIGAGLGGAGNGIHITQTGANSKINGNIINSCYKGISLTAASGCHVTSNIIDTTAEESIYGNSTDLVIKNCRATAWNGAAATYAAIRITSLGTRSEVTGCFLTTETNAGRGVLSEASYVSISGNKIFTTTTGIELAAATADANKISNNFISTTTIAILAATNFPVSIIGNFIHSTASYGIHKTGTGVQGIVDLNTISAPGNHAIYIQTSGKNLSVSHNAISNCAGGSAIYLAGDGAITCTGNSIIGAAIHGIHLIAPNITVSQNVIRGFNGWGAGIGILNTNTASACVISNNWIGEPAIVATTGISISADNVNVNSNFIDGTTLEGIYIGAVNRANVTNNLIQNCTTYGIRSISDAQFAIDSNMILLSDIGIYYNGSAVYSSISKNTITTANTAGIQVAGTGVGLQINENKILTVATGSGILVTGDGKTQIHNNLIQDLSVHGIYVNALECSVKGNYVFTFNIAGAGDGIVISAASHRSSVCDNYIEDDSTLVGVAIDVYSDNTLVESNLTYSTDIGISINAGSNCLVNGNYILSTSNVAIAVAANNHHTVTGNKINTAVVGIYKSGTGTISITANYVFNCSGIGIQLFTSGAATVTGNHVHTATNGFQIATDYANLTGNTVQGCSLAGIYFTGSYGNINSNIVYSNGTNGITMLTGDQNVINCNNVQSNTGDGINISNTSDRIIITSNIILSNTVNQLVNNGTNTVAANNIVA